jgi:hypothetical protein
MISIPPPISNYERQQNFRARNPGYYNRYNARRKAAKRAAMQQPLAVMIAGQAIDAQQAQAKGEPLMLPAPAEKVLEQAA